MSDNSLRRPRDAFLSARGLRARLGGPDTAIERQRDQDEAQGVVRLGIEVSLAAVMRPLCAAAVASKRRSGRTSTRLRLRGWAVIRPAA